MMNSVDRLLEILESTAIDQAVEILKDNGFVEKGDGDGGSSQFERTSGGLSCPSDNDAKKIENCLRDNGVTVNRIGLCVNVIGVESLEIEDESIDQDDNPVCTCPECGTESEHTRGTPCSKKSCPECGAIMTGSACS